MNGLLTFVTLSQPMFSALPAGVLSFASPKESHQRKGGPGVGAGPCPLPCATRPTRGLRNSGCALRQCSPFFRAGLRCSAPSKEARGARFERGAHGDNRFAPLNAVAGPMARAVEFSMSAGPVLSAWRAGVLSFASPKESSQRKGDPWVGAGRCPVPCATHPARGLRNSGCALKQCSPSSRAGLRCSAPLKGVRGARFEPLASRRACFLFSTGKACLMTAVLGLIVSSRRDCVGMGTEPISRGRRRAMQAGAEKGRALSEGQGPELRSPRSCRIAQGTGLRPAPPSGRLLFAYFFLAKQEKVRRASGAKAGVGTKGKLHVVDRTVASFGLASFADGQRP